MFAKATFFNSGNPYTTEDEKQKKSISVAIVEMIFMCLISVLGINALVVLVAQGVHIPFKVYLAVSPIISLLCLLGSWWIYSKQIKNTAVKDYDVLIKLLILGLISAILIMLSPSTRNDTDDFYYISNAVYFLDHPNEPLDFQIHFLVGETNKPIISPSQGTSMAYEYFRAVIAHYSNIKYLAVYFLSPIGMGFILPLALFLLTSCFVNDSRHALLGTIVCMTLILISTDGARTYGILAFGDAIRGKFFVLSTGIPLFAAFSISFLKKPSKIGWLCLLLCTLTMIGITPSAAVLLTILAIILLSTSILIFWVNSNRIFDWKYMLLYAGSYISSLVGIFLYVLFLLWMLKSGYTSGNYAVLLWTSKFLGQLRLFSNLAFPLTPMLMILSPVLVFITLKGWQRQFLLLWTALLVIFFLNPIGTELFIDRLVPSNIYWRLFYLFPFPLAIGVTVANFSFSNRSRHIFEICIMLIALAIYLLVIPKGQSISFSSYKQINNLTTAQKIANIAPPGAMLAPRDLCTLFPIIDGFHPQIRIRRDGNRLWLTKTDYIRRERASEFANGKVIYIEDFSQLLEQNIVQSIVLRKTLLNGSIRDKVRLTLKSNGFVHEKEVGGYFIVWK